MQEKLKFTDRQLLWLNRFIQNSTDGSFSKSKKDRNMCDKIINIISEETKRRGYFSKYATKKERAKYGYE